MSPTRLPALSEHDEAVCQARAEVAWFEWLLERLETVPGSWVDWDYRMTCSDRQEKAAEECTEALRQARERLADAIKPHEVKL